jgi:Zn-dependent protease
MQGFDITRIVYTLIPMILALTVHEYFHAWTAHKLGDDTAARMGRLTLNPIAHIDPIGTLLIPIIGIGTGAPFFGWAKPVPISPVQFSRRMRMKTGVLITSAAGPLSNLVFGFVCAGLLSIIGHSIGIEVLFGKLAANTGVTVALIRLLGWLAMINIGLFVFNLLPVPPLDGGGVLAGLLPDRFHPMLDTLARYSFVFFIAIMVLGGRFLAVPVQFIVELFSSIVNFPIWLAFYGSV